MPTGFYLLRFGYGGRGLIEDKHLARMQSLSKSEHISLARIITATYKPFLQPFDKTQYADDPAVAKLLPCNSGGAMVIARSNWIDDPSRTASWHDLAETRLTCLLT